MIMNTTTEPFTPSADLARPTVADAVVGHETYPLFIRKPNPDDGWGIYELVKSCPHWTSIPPMPTCC